MSFTKFHSLFDIQPASDIASPQPARQKAAGKRPQSLRDIGLIPDIELDPIPPGKTDKNAQMAEPPAEMPIETQPPSTPNELEMSRPSTPRQDEAFGVIRSWNSPPITKWRILCCCLIYLTNGINDSVVGALIPYMESYYHISYSIMSLVFIGNATGFLSAAFFTNIILGKLGRARTLMASEVLQLCASIILVCTPPYPLVVVTFFLLGYGEAMNLALNNVYCSHTHPPSVILGLTQGMYGLGGILAPIIGTTIVSRGGFWSRFYFLTIGLRVCGIIFSGVAFHSYQEGSEENLLEVTVTRQSAVEEAASKMRDLKLALKSRVTIFGALFLFAYQGAEVSISGWIISYLIKYRDGDPAKVGYVTAGFWGGITLGRFVLTHAGPRIGEKTFVVILTLGTAVLQLLAWLIPNLITNAVTVALLGLLLGPVYPCTQTIWARLMPRHIQTTAIGLMAAAGSSGGAVAPFTTGILAQAAGTWVLHPVCIGLYGVMLVCLFALPRVVKRTE